MVQFRKRKKVGPFRFTVSRRGISTSVGAGPLRFSLGADGKLRRTVCVPGAGTYDTKVIGGRTGRSTSTPEPTAREPAPGVTESPKFMTLVRDRGVQRRPVLAARDQRRAAGLCRGSVSRAGVARAGRQT